MQEQPKIPKKPLLYYVVMVMLVMMLLNIFVFPLLLQPRVTEVDYGTFMSDVEAGKVTEANLDDGYVYYAIPNEKNPKQTDLYMTGQMPNDTGLVDRLYEKGVKFSNIVPEKASPLMSFLLTWILPLAVFALIGQFFMRSMQKRMGGGGNAMTFGKSNAKI